MSFAAPDLEASPAAYTDFPEFDSLSQNIDNNVYNVNNNQLSAVRKLLAQYDELLQEEPLDGAVKSHKISSKISSTLKKTTESFQRINETTSKLNTYLNECELNHEDDDALKYLRQKESLLIRLIKQSLEQFQRQQLRFEQLQRKAVEKYGKPEQVDQNPATSDNTPSTESQQIQITYEPVNAEELEQQTLLIQEREREIHQINQDTSYINEIFSNLQDIIHEQQFSIDNIENNVYNFSTNARGALNELRQAERYQRRSSGRMF
jgi:syntaxin 7